MLFLMNQCQGFFFCTNTTLFTLEYAFNFVTYFSNYCHHQT